MAKILHVRVQQTWLIIRVKKFLPTIYLLAKVHPLQTDRRADRRLTTTISIARPLLKYGRLKT